MTKQERVEYSKKYRENNKKYLKELCKKYRENNKEYIKEQYKKFYDNNTEWYKEYRKNNKELIREQANKNSEKLTDGYIIKVLSKNNAFLRKGNIPQQLIEVRRLHLQIIRLKNQLLKGEKRCLK